MDSRDEMSAPEHLRRYCPARLHLLPARFALMSTREAPRNYVSVSLDKPLGLEFLENGVAWRIPYY